MEDSRSIGCFSFSFCEVLFIIFLILKLTHTIDWSWWWITAPLWIGFVVWLFFIVIGIICAILVNKNL